MIALEKKKEGERQTLDNSTSSLQNVLAMYGRRRSHRAKQFSPRRRCVIRQNNLRYQEVKVETLAVFHANCVYFF